METVLSREFRNHLTFTVEIPVNNVGPTILMRLIIADSPVKSEILVNDVRPVDTETLTISSS